MKSFKDLAKLSAKILKTSAKLCRNILFLFTSAPFWKPILHYFVNHTFSHFGKTLTHKPMQQTNIKQPYYTDVSQSQYVRCNWSILWAVLSCTDCWNLVFSVAKLLLDLYCQIFSIYIANKSLKLSFTLDCVLKRANNLKTISNWFVKRFQPALQKFNAVPQLWKSFLNPSDTQ